MLIRNKYVHVELKIQQISALNVQMIYLDVKENDTVSVKSKLQMYVRYNEFQIMKSSYLIYLSAD